MFTAAAPALIVQFGSISILLLTTGLLAFWLIFGMINCQRTKQKLAAEQMFVEARTPVTNSPE